MASEITLRPFDPVSDWQHLRDWLHQPHVMQWWGDAEQEVQGLLQRSPDRCAIIAVDGVPAGFLLWQPAPRDELEAAGLGDLPAGLVDIDIMFGEPEFIGRGAGPAALALLLDCLRADPAMSHAGVGTSLANLRAISAFERAGFRLYRRFDDPQAGPCQYMVRELRAQE